MKERNHTMKIRSGFVSNSSSSSFCCVGINDRKTIDELLWAVGIDPDEAYSHFCMGVIETPSVNFYGYCQDVDIAGIDVEEYLETTCLPALRQKFVTVCENLGVPLDILTCKPEFFYGECSDE